IRQLSVLHSFPTRRSSDLCSECEPVPGRVTRQFSDAPVGPRQCGAQEGVNLGAPLMPFMLERERGECEVGLRVPPSVALKHERRSEEHTSELQSLAYTVCR